MIDSIKQLLQQEAQAVLNIPVTDAYEKAVQLIVEQIHQKKGKLVTSGMGKAGQIAMNIATTFCSTGIPSVFLHPSEAQHGDLGILQKNDLLLLISNSGKTREIVELTRLAHNLDPELKFIVITGNPDSPLANESNVCLSTGKPAEVCTLGMTPTTSTTAMTVIGDILVVQTMKKTGFTIDEEGQKKLLHTDTHFSTFGTNNEEGSGLGLLLCQDFAVKSGGKLWFTSKKGEGSTFYFSIPLKK